MHIFSGGGVFSLDPPFNGCPLYHRQEGELCSNLPKILAPVYKTDIDYQFHLWYLIFIGCVYLRFPYIGLQLNPIHSSILSSNPFPKSEFLSIQLRKDFVGFFKSLCAYNDHITQQMERKIGLFLYEKSRGLRYRCYWLWNDTYSWFNDDSSSISKERWRVHSEQCA